MALRFEFALGTYVRSVRYLARSGVLFKYPNNGIALHVR